MDLFIEDFHLYCETCSRNSRRRCLFNVTQSELKKNVECQDFKDLKLKRSELSEFLSTWGALKNLSGTRSKFKWQTKCPRCGKNLMIELVFDKPESNMPCLTYSNLSNVCSTYFITGFNFGLLFRKLSFLQSTPELTQYIENLTYSIGHDYESMQNSTPEQISMEFVQQLQADGFVTKYYKPMRSYNGFVVALKSCPQVDYAADAEVLHEIETFDETDLSSPSIKLNTQVFAFLIEVYKSGRHNKIEVSNIIESYDVLMKSNFGFEPYKCYYIRSSKPSSCHYSKDKEVKIDPMFKGGFVLREAVGGKMYFTKFALSFRNKLLKQAKTQKK